MSEVDTGKKTEAVLSDPDNQEPPVKSRIVAGLLGIFLGGAGVHRFYLGYPRIGIAQLVFTVVTAGFGVIWGMADGFLFMMGAKYKDGKGRYLK